MYFSTSTAESFGPPSSVGGRSESCKRMIHQVVEKEIPKAPAYQK